MKKERVMIPLKLESPVIAVLDEIVEHTGTNRTAVLRQLIPSKPVLDAIKEYMDAGERGQVDVTSVLLAAFADMLQTILTRSTTSWCLDEQIRYMTRNCTSSERANIISRLYCKWRRSFRYDPDTAKPRNPDYQWEKVTAAFGDMTAACLILYCNNPEAPDYDAPVTVEALRNGVQKVLEKDLMQLANIQKQVDQIKKDISN